MTGSLNALFAATVVFVAGHFLLSSKPLRTPLLNTLGQNGFLIAYSLIIGAAFAWMLAAYQSAPVVAVWTPHPALRWIPLLVMPVAIYLVIAGLSTPNPTSVGAERRLDIGGPGIPATGVLSITRHPMLWGITLWAASHFGVASHLASLTLIVGMLVLCLGGMAHIDARREEALGAAWGPIKMNTGAVPFEAILTRRAKLDWRGIGWWRPALALVLYAAILHGHEWLIGVPVLAG